MLVGEVDVGQGGELPITLVVLDEPTQCFVMQRHACFQPTRAEHAPGGLQILGHPCTFLLRS